LIRASATVNLNVRSQKFLFHLLIELSLSTTSMISSRQRSQDIITIEQQYDKFKLPKLPKKFRDLLTVINIINALIDKNKQQQYVKQCLEQSYNILGQNLKITEDDVQTSYTLF
ncbi:unnamed protein product, partial [Rotaria sp. Silwood1]